MTDSDLIHFVQAQDEVRPAVVAELSAGHLLFTKRCGSRSARGRIDMQKVTIAFAPLTATIVATAWMMLSVRSAHAELSLEDLMHKCLQLEHYWALKSMADTTGSIPNDGSAICFGYLLAFRGLQGAVVGIDCVSAQSCRQTFQFCIPEQTADAEMLSAFIAYTGNHMAQWHEGAAVHYLNAMHESFPCKTAP
jgi:Rap1a immunity proteins